MITVPEAGIVGGRSADIRIERPDIGGFVAQAGAAVAQKMGQIKDQQRAVVTQKTQLDMTKELGQERLRFEQMTDPAEIDQQWPQVEAAIRDKYVNQKDANGNPLFTPDEADALGLSFQNLSQRHALALGERTVKLTQSQAEAAWLEARTDIVTTAAGADPDSLAAYLDYGKAAIDQLGKQTGKMPAQIVAEQQAYEAEVMNARLIAAMDQDPAATIAAIDAGTYNALGAEAVAQRRATAQAEVDRRAAAAATAAEAETKKRTDDIGKRLDTIGELTVAGRKVPDVDFVLNAPDEVKANPKYPRALARVKLGQEIPNLDLMTPAQLDQLITAERAREIVEPWENERLPVLIEMRDKKATALATDPKAALAASGLPVPEIPAFDPANPEPFVAALQESLSFDAFQRDKGYSDQSAIFTKDQKAELKAILAPGADADAKAALAVAILQGTGGNAAPVLSALEADPTFRRTVKVLGLTGDTGLAQSILRGQQKMDTDTVLKLPRADQIRIFDEITGGVFLDAPVAVREELMAASAAVYADGATGIDPADQPDDAAALFEQSLVRVMGAQPDRNGSYTIGGLQEVNGSLTVLPVGLPVTAVETAWETLADQFDAAPTDPAALPMQAFKAASHYGGLPDLGTDPGGRLGTLILLRVDESEIYELGREEGGRITKVKEKGRDIVYRFKLRDLVRGAQP
jgi:hypothetical protein